MNTIENIFLDAGMSWTISKSLPYIIMIILGIILAYVFRKKLNKNRWTKWSLRLLLFVLPFSLYFIYSPIYEGDFTNNSLLIGKSPEHAELTGNKLVVLSMPQCPYCYASIDRMLKLKERVPEAEIEYIVCSSVLDSNFVNWYQEKGGDQITVRFADSSAALSMIANYSFPTFVLLNGNHDMQVWSNDNFGVVAMDEVELKLK